MFQIQAYSRVCPSSLTQDKLLLPAIPTLIQLSFLCHLFFTYSSSTHFLSGCLHLKYSQFPHLLISICIKMSVDGFSLISEVPSRHSSQMNRYHVKIALDANPTKTINLLVPFSPQSTLAELTTEVRRRLEKQDVDSRTASTTFEIYLSDSEGPLLDAEDRLCDIIHGEGLFFKEHKQSKVSQLDQRQDAPC